MRAFCVLISKSPILSQNTRIHYTQTCIEVGKWVWYYYIVIIIRRTKWAFISKQAQPNRSKSNKIFFLWQMPLILGG